MGVRSAAMHARLSAMAFPWPRSSASVPAERALRVDDAHDGPAELLRLLHQTQRLSVPFGLRAAEVAFDALFQIGAFLLGDDGDRASSHPSDAADDGGVVGERHGPRAAPRSPRPCGRGKTTRSDGARCERAGRSPRRRSSPCTPSRRAMPARGRSRVARASRVFLNPGMRERSDSARSSLRAALLRSRVLLCCARDRAQARRRRAGRERPRARRACRSRFTMASIKP